ncbi:MAG TPA: class I SAM-dependent methyltransferase [Bacteroidales bacterium]|nr:class I SAM-dependent methyltransferase [Bacteroidales bacterium]
MDNYNAIADNYNEFEQNAITLWHLGYPVVTDLLGNINGKSVLDYGCGTGTFSRFLQSKKASVTGVDVSENMIEVAKSNSSDKIAYYPISSGGLDFIPDNMFDFVVSNFVLCTVPSRREISMILDQIYRVLKKGGLFVFMNSNWDKSNGKEFISFKLEYCNDLVAGHPVTAIIKSDPPIMLHDYFWPIAEYRKLLQESGFRINAMREKIAEGDDVRWLDEREFPPYYVISAGK